MSKEMKTYLKIIIAAIVLLIIVASAFFLATGCTLSVTTLHTQGQASDVVDETQAPNTQVNPNVEVPVSAIPVK